MFARAPKLGKVKTRLEPMLDQAGVLAFYKRLVRHCLKQVQPYGAVELWVDDDPKNLPEEWLKLVSEVHCQRGEGLGERLIHAAGAKPGPVALIGSDCPDLNAAYLQQAHEHLQHNAVLLGPARDGGFVLLACQALQPHWFSDIAWGGPEVRQKLLENLSSDGVKASQLPELRDIDTPEDVRWLSSGGLSELVDTSC